MATAREPPWEVKRSFNSPCSTRSGAWTAMRCPIFGPDDTGSFIFTFGCLAFLVPSELNRQPQGLLHEAATGF